ncbi:DUF4935 domain-containing protein [bacterium]|nr:DUF4935 domain-containing protein [bacterium]
MGKDEFSIDLNEIYPSHENLLHMNIKSVDEINNKAIYVIDTNVLLLLFSIGKLDLQEIKEKYKALIDQKRLLIPEHVIREFVKNRPEKIKELYQKICGKLSRIENVKHEEYPIFSDLKQFKDLTKLEREINTRINKYRKTIIKLREKIQNWNWNDPISNMYKELLMENVIAKLEMSNDDLKTDIERRAEYMIPPGLKDQKKEQNSVGDIVIWNTILSIAKKYKAHIIFVSSEEKNDWWCISNKEALYPRFELVEEFYRKTNGKTFQIIQFSQFLKIQAADKDMISEVADQEKALSKTFWENFQRQVENSRMALEKFQSLVSIIDPLVIEIKRYSPLYISNERVLECLDKSSSPDHFLSLMLPIHKISRFMKEYDGDLRADYYKLKQKYSK